MLAGMEWKPLSPDSFCQAKEHEPDLAIKTASLIPGISSMQVSEPPNPLSSTLFDWDGDKEPVDIDRNMQDVTLVEVSRTLLPYLETGSKLKSQRVTAQFW